MFQLMPVFTFLKRNSEITKMCENEISCLFIEKLISVSNHDTIRVCYEMSDLLRTLSDEEVASIAIHCIHFLKQTIEFVRRVSC